jgi:thiol-disulfide isomerase/thioredoxin
MNRIKTLATIVCLLLLYVNVALGQTPFGFLWGHVVDEQGNGVQGAKVTVSMEPVVTTPPVKIIGRKTMGVCMGWPEVELTTDANGGWQLENPPVAFQSASVRVFHPEYVSKRYERVQQVKIEDGVAQELKTPLFAGDRVACVVKDPTGQPVSGALVVVGVDFVGSGQTTVLRTDAAGRVRFAVERGVETIVTVMHSGFSPSQQRVRMASATADVSQLTEINFGLEPGKTLVGRIVDTQGKPAAGATVAVSSWRNTRVWSPRVSVDAQGRFEVPDAPADEFELDIFGTNFRSSRDIAVEAGQEVVVTVEQPVRVTGRVTDAKTGEPISRFRVLRGQTFPGESKIHWDTYNTPIFNGSGALDVIFDEPQLTYAVRIEAPGYEPVESAAFDDSKKGVELDFKLEPAQRLAGRVVNRQGDPVAGVQVVAVQLGEQSYISGGEFEVGNHDIKPDPATISSATGEFSLASLVMGHTYILRATGEAGTGWMMLEDFLKDRTMKLVPWGVIEGRAFIGSEPARHIRIFATSHAELPSVFDSEKQSEFFRSLYMNDSATTDHEGRFAIRYMPVGPVSLHRSVEIGGGMSTSVDTQRVEVIEGTVTSVQIGGVGRPVVGQVVLPEMSASAADAGLVYRASSTATLNRVVNLPDVPMPAEVLASNDDAQQAWLDAFFKSEEGQKSQENRMRLYSEQAKFYCVVLDPSGRFRVEHVLPGEYTLRIPIERQLQGDQIGITTQELVGTAQARVVVPEQDQPYVAEPIVVPTLTPVAEKSSKVGDALPDFSFTTLAGTPISLADMKGKYVVLHFWATWCGPCMAQMPEVSKMHETLKNDADVVVISLSFDQDHEKWTAAVNEQNMVWPQVLIGQQDQALTRDLVVQGIPRVVLVGPDGKVIAPNVGKSDAADRIKQHRIRQKSKQ